MGHYTFRDPLSGLGTPSLPEGVTKEQLIEALTACGLSAVGTAITSSSGSATLNAVADCLWEQLWVVIDANPNRDLILEGITTLGCSEALSMAGLPSEVAAIVCGLGSDTWTKVQDRAGRALREIAWDRGEDRPADQGGGHTLVDAAGQVIVVACDNPSMSDGYEYVEPGGGCPTTTTGTGEPASSLNLRLRPTTSFLRGGTVTGVVTDATGNPIYGAEVRTGSALNVPVRTAADGSFAAPSIASSNVRLFVTAKGYDGSLIEGLVVGSNATLNVGTVVLPMVEKEDDVPDDAPKPWYKSPLVWIGAVCVAGGVGYLIYQYRK